MKVEHIKALLSWDQETGAPPLSMQERSEQSELLSSLYYQKATAEGVKEAVSSLCEDDGTCLEDKALIRRWKKYYRTEAMLPETLVSRYAREVSMGQSLWEEAKAKNDYRIFQPQLETLVSLAREKAAIIGKGEKPYDALLDLYEDGMTVRKLDSLFASLAPVVQKLVSAIEEHPPIDDGFLRIPYDVPKLQGFLSWISGCMGFDTQRGGVGVSAHPFTITLGVDDVRITNRFSDPSIFDAIASQIHETGHAIYDQGASTNGKIRGTSLGAGVSMGIHESQSRLWENFLGRSKDFWIFAYPELQKAVTGLKDVSLGQFVLAINKVGRSAIRTNADELTYNLHIILRYELEKKLIDGSLAVKDAAEAWNSMSSMVLGYRPKDYGEGILQDCHWAGGDFGYFPTYVLGNFYAAAFLEQMKKEFDVASALSHGRFSEITRWQNEHIWQKGGILLPEQLCYEATGHVLDAGPFTRYLENKFSNL